MTDLDFRCTGVRPEPFGASPTLLFDLRIEELDHQPVHAVALRCQIRIEPAQRTYEPDEVDMLGDLFGEPSRWSSTLKPLQFAHASITVPAFTGTTHVDLPVPCTYDTEVASASYFRALARGEIPLLMLFSGTVFTGRNGFRAEPIPWHKETSCLMPVDVWRELIESYFPNTGWLRLRKDTLESLRRYRSARALPSWEQVFEELLASAEATRAKGVE
ncbi:DUF6084 family protein [Streptomyces microflavus]|uniref:Uncharacterized protein n=1 Tax=Streptomyces microflavus TaxID=1919 RepID=A0A7J0D2Y8_STRMI|nr:MULTISPECIES: DUF6084 family protein [Streptomyces]MDX2980564.1 DUF6084 family protein [Streptomyces sp. NRRL_B-2249]GFN09096.1 hypothetical protein Smic_76520 [Streptomyces microflavus]GGX58859.1 hypothetical protein GCM10010298_24420 [Streptomyces microflavus]